jgi:Protein of unknown function (DUF3572)
MAAKRGAPDVHQVAETVAIQALSFLVGEPALLGRFLAETGLGPESLRGAAKSPGFLVSVLDFVLSDDGMVKDFAKAAELTPVTVAAARQALGGADWERNEP